MIKSMTGFGKGTAVAGAATVTVEIKTVNHRFCDISVKAPRSLLVLESELRKRVGERLRRGKIDLFITLEFASGGSAIPTINQPLAEAYYNLFEQLRTRFALSGEVPLALLAGQRDVLQLQEGQVPEAQLHGAVDAALLAALDRVETMRRNEGEATRHDMEERLALLDNLLEQIAARARQVPGEWQAKLRERLARLAPDVAFDPQRVAQEVALFADRCDISEELTRFRSHLKQFAAFLATPDAVGRQLDFLVQELNREVNTIGSKSNDAELTRHVVSIKSELEKIREQVQNVE